MSHVYIYVYKKSGKRDLINFFVISYFNFKEFKTSGQKNFWTSTDFGQLNIRKVFDFNVADYESADQEHE